MNREKAPKWITSLQPNEVFVFGSNRQGVHGAGAAKAAMKWGAKRGIGEGLSGATYAIPTKETWRDKSGIPLEELRGHVQMFIRFAKSRPELRFLVTAIGTGYAGFTADVVAPLFAETLDIDNILLPQEFAELLTTSLIKK